MIDKLIYKKMVSVMSAIGAIHKTQKNQAQGFSFRGIDQVLNALYPALVEHEVMLTPRCLDIKSQLKDVIRTSGKPGIDKHTSVLMEYDFTAIDGSFVTVGPIPGEAIDSGDKATTKALSAALKYALIQTFSIPTEDIVDADAETHVLNKQTQPVPSKQQPVASNQLPLKNFAPTRSTHEPKFDPQVPKGPQSQALQNKISDQQKPRM